MPGLCDATKSMGRGRQESCRVVGVEDSFTQRLGAAAGSKVLSYAGKFSGPNLPSRGPCGRVSTLYSYSRTLLELGRQFGEVGSPIGFLNLDYFRKI